MPKSCCRPVDVLQYIQAWRLHTSDSNVTRLKHILERCVQIQKHHTKLQPTVPTNIVMTGAPYGYKKVALHLLQLQLSGAAIGWKLQFIFSVLMSRKTLLSKPCTFLPQKTSWFKKNNPSIENFVLVFLSILIIDWILQKFTYLSFWDVSICWFS